MVVTCNTNRIWDFLNTRGKVVLTRKTEENCAIVPVLVLDRVPAAVAVAVAEVEVEAGRPPSMPRNDANFNLGKFQQGFLRFIRPFFVSVTIIDGVNLTELISNLDKNLVTWKEKEAKEAEAEVGKEVGIK